MILLTAKNIIANDLLEKPVEPKTLAIILIGNNKASALFVSLKQKRAELYGIKTELIRFDENVEEKVVISEIEKLNANEAIDGVIIQLPLPNQVDTDTVINAIAPEKDVDGLGQNSVFESPMVLAVQALVEHYKIDLKHEKVAVVGYGRLVGQPIAKWLNSQEIEPKIIQVDLDDRLISSASVIFAGTGERGLINDSNTRYGQIIFDCSGVDVDFEAVKDKCQAITPPLGAIGPLTVHFLLKNTLETE